MDPDELLDAVMRGETPLLAEGGRVDVEELAEKYGA
jgi:hypothetical protein